MGYYISNIIGINTNTLGNLYDDRTDFDKIKSDIANVIRELRETDFDPRIADDPSHCLSHELVGGKGGMIVLAGVFNYWGFNSASEFAKRLSARLDCKVVLTSVDDEVDDMPHCQVYRSGVALFILSEEHGVLYTYPSSGR